MNQALLDKIVNAVLYEGYILYPYRPSIKNHQRWTFGGVYPRVYSEAQTGSDGWTMQTECLVRGDGRCKLQVKVRFLHIQQRHIKQLDAPIRNLEADDDPPGCVVESLKVGSQHYQSWQEATEREIAQPELTLVTLSPNPSRVEFRFPGSRQFEPIRDSKDEILGLIEREQQTIVGTLEVAAQQLSRELFKIRARIENHSPLHHAQRTNREEALLRSLISTHTILEMESGEFISLFDPPQEFRELAAGCRNIGCWPVLVGTEGERDTMLSSPIILYDYPEIAPESPGDLFDATEIDEILSLRILTLTDEEKQSAAAVDSRVRALLQRTESLGELQFQGLHGTMRRLAPCVSGRNAMNEWEPLVHWPKPASIKVGDIDLEPGDRVRLCPLGRADILDIALEGRTATIESIEQDFEGRIYLAVTVDSDPGKDLGALKQPGHRFFFGIDEVEPLDIHTQGTA